MKKHIPNLLTCLNLFSGCIALVLIFKGELITASYFVVLSGFFDFFDGFAARLLKAYSPMGKELDSLADVISFGAVPGAMLYKLLIDMLGSDFFLWTIPAFLITVFSALRLAKFNIDERQGDMFIGLNTPANTMLIVAIPHIIPLFPSLITWWPYIILVLIPISCFLLVCELPFIAIKFKDFSWNNNKLRYIFIIGSAVLIILFKFAAIPIAILLYIILSIVQFKILA
ncbi:CDP-diacylglycerol--serine O-phosphatidyltransferase [Solitalea koreensis]|uniref:CDP-diacylglycerol--serine O-phosphatidyltransferase n=1 Tax=Solitalea koreensis TaxID=543615 RepID=A0A521D9C4_9SPHI|nr:CDP-diacylglycerol--serine O-phosphatidyltransferase [Solitalea koreensis]SMO68225.1 CDP-diacylglycerol---serine O-phosphatidyltransferase [Solitalea koreensis]